MGPTELIKVQLSVSTTMGKDRKRPLPLIADIIRQHGFTGLTRGLWLTWLRDCPSVGVYFLAYEYLKVLFATNNKLSVTAQLCAGGFAGCLSWASTYPFDVLKTHVQTGRSNTLSAAAKDIMKTEGIYGFVRGSMPCLVRAFPVNATIFFVYEFLVSLARQQ